MTSNPTPRITPPDLSISPYKDFIEHLAVRWVVAELPAPISYLYGDYVMAIGMLLEDTQCMEQTQLIFMSTLNQAMALGKSSKWLDDELCFESVLYTTRSDRATFLRCSLERALALIPDKVDVCLDRYNERLVRFAPLLTDHDE